MRIGQRRTIQESRSDEEGRSGVYKVNEHLHSLLKAQARNRGIGKERSGGRRRRE